MNNSATHCYRFCWNLVRGCVVGDRRGRGIVEINWWTRWQMVPKLEMVKSQISAEYW